MISEFFAIKKALIHEKGLTTTKGGRFLHVMGNADKGSAIKKMNTLIRHYVMQDFTTIGLGDSENDIAMLREVNIPVVIRKKDGSHLNFEGNTPFTITENAGPQGWNKFISQYLQHLLQEKNITGASHG